MARAKKEAALTPEERLQAALVPDWEWPYKLPENWCWVKLVESFDNYTDSKKKIKQNDYLVKGRLAVVDQGQELIGGYTNDVEKSYSGTLPVVIFGDHTRCIKFVDFPFAQGADGVKVLRPKPFYLPKAFYYALQSVNIPNLGYRRHFPLFNKFSIPLPPFAEQQRIVDRIESLFTKLDEAKEKAQAVVDSFETRKAAILHKAFTGELTAKWREEHGAIDNTVLIDVKNYSSSWPVKEKDLLSREQAKSEIVVLDNGHEWIRCTIGAVGRVTNGSTPLRKEPKYWSGKIPWISSGEVRNNIIESSNECISEEGYANSSVKLLPIGTVLIAMIGEGKTRGQSAILNIEATINQNVAAIVVEHNCVLPYYIWYWLQMNYAKNREKGSGSGPQALNCQRVRELDFFVPNLKEQKEVVNILRKALAKEQQSKEAAEAVLDQIDLMKKSILARAFRGELGTNDPSEESAVELLKRTIL